jgi:hypothetical protein
LFAFVSHLENGLTANSFDVTAPEGMDRILFKLVGDPLNVCQDFGYTGLCDDIVDNFSVDIGQSEIATTISVCELGVI